MAFNALQISGGVAALTYFENLTRRIEEITWSVEENKTLPPKILEKQLLDAASRLAARARRRGLDDEAEHWDQMIAGYETAVALLKLDGVPAIRTGENL